MTASPKATSEMDQLDQLGAKAFDGFLVRKDLVRCALHRVPLALHQLQPLLQG